MSEDKRKITSLDKIVFKNLGKAPSVELGDHAILFIKDNKIYLQTNQGKVYLITMTEVIL